jgi:hypothetical protein
MLIALNRGLNIPLRFTPGTAISTAIAVGKGG